mgnify:FL=1
MVHKVMSRPHPETDHYHITTKRIDGYTYTRIFYSEWEAEQWLRQYPSVRPFAQVSGPHRDCNIT